MGRGPRAAGIVLALAVSASCFCALAITDTVDVQVRAPAKMDGTIRPADERETYVVELPEGAKVTASVKRKGKGELVPVIEVVEPDDDVIAGVTSGKATKITGYITPETGAYRFRITGDGENDGDYKAKIKAKYKRLFGTVDGGSVDPGATAEFVFAAPAGAKVGIRCTPAQGSAFVPVIESVRAPDDSVTPIDPPEDGSTKHKAKLGGVPETGDYRITVRNAGATPGSFAIAVKLTPAATTKTKVDLRDRDGDELSEEGAVYGRPVDEGGGVIEPSQDGSNIDDVSVEVPPDAVSGTIVLTISEDENFFVEDGENAGSPAVTFGPPGTEFAEALTVTIPFNPQAYDDPESELSIVVRDSETGELETIPGPYDIDILASTATVSLSHFSTLQATSPRPRPVKGTFFEVEVLSGPLDDYGGEFGISINPVSAKFGGRNGNAVEFTRDERRMEWRRGTGAPELELENVSGGPPETGLVQLGTNADFAFDLLSSPRIYRRGRSDNLGVGITDRSMRLFLRRAKRNPTKLTLAGLWHIFVYEFSAKTNPTGEIDLRRFGGRADILVAQDGTIAPLRSFTVSNLASFPSGGWENSAGKQKPKRGRLTPNGGTARLDVAFGGDPQLTEVDLIPALRGDLLIGRAQRLEGSPGAPTLATLRLVALVRGAQNAGNEDFVGHAFLKALTSPAVNTDTGQTVIPTNSVKRLEIEADSGGAGRFTISSTGVLTLNDAASGRVIMQPLQSQSGPGTYRVRPDGRYVDANAVFGALTRRRGLIFGLIGGAEEFGLVLGVPGPPLDTQ